MIKELQIQNFKAWKDTGRFRLAPLTVLFGANSAGKSSLGHLLLALKQTAVSSDRKRALVLGDSNTLIDLGTFDDCLHNHDPQNEMSFFIRWGLPKELKIVDPKQGSEVVRANEISLKTVLKKGKNGQPEVFRIEYRLFHDNREVLDVDFLRNSKNQFDLESKAYRFKKNIGRGWPLEEPEKFYRASDLSLARFDNADFLVDMALAVEKLLGQLYYLGPLREAAKRTYLWSGDAPEDVGLKGEKAIAAILAAQAEGRQLNRKIRGHMKAFPEFIADWMKELGVIKNFRVKSVAEGRKEYEVLVETGYSTSEVKLTDVGVGVSQVLPALVQAFYTPPNSLVWMEQPEIHLHPQVQSKLADVMISAIQSNVPEGPRNIQLVIESHSEHFLNRLQRRVAEGKIKTTDVAVYFCRETKSGPALEELKLDEEGNILNWPENFFGDEMEDALARTKAAMDRRNKHS